MPDAPISVQLVGTWPRSAEFDRVSHIPNVSIVPVEPSSLFATSPGGSAGYADLFERLCAGSPAALSNLVRLGVLYRDGGVYLDTDTIVLRPLHDPDEHGAFVGVERVWSLNRRRL